ncbi:hypothetical protein NOR_04881 [Metarhizium rileyi]|uniref:Uncharacterized protein n=1 Tax=Metarhizium rileyi (strain RCEF 4871) TaxID=1649241 RepID=A0A167DR71_METRR|nr:hypothetical protein NOR_04881 [Metarhizium rileyi RCEF 4871]
MARPASLNTAFMASSLDDAGSPLSPLGSNPLLFHRRSQTDLEGSHLAGKKLGRPCSDVRFHRVTSNPYAGDLHDTMLQAEKIRARQARDDLAALVDFLKNHPPPPDNFMSKPYEEEDDRGRWSKIKNLGRRSKSVPKQPQPIQLPDSAVAGVTTGGHRHIAISIPLDATPYGLETRSQYPVFADGPRMGATKKEPIRTFRNEKGVVTVLRPLAEVYESDNGSTSRFRPSYMNSHGRRPPPLPPHKPTNSLTGQTHDYIGVLPTGLDTPFLDDSSAPWHISRSSLKGEGCVGKQDVTSFRRSAYPARASSMVSNRSVKHPPSIDGLIIPQNQAVTASHGACSNECSKSLTNAPRRAHSTSNNNPADKPKFVARRSKSGPLKRDLNPVPSRNGSQTRPTALTMADSPVLSTPEESRPASLVSMRSRKDMVNERKRRDIEAAKCITKDRLQHEQDASNLIQQPSTGHMSPRPVAEQSNGSASTKSGPLTLTLSNLMVVMDVKPCSPDEKDVLVRPKTAPSQTSPQETLESPIPSVVNNSGVLTPPTSTRGSPSHRRSVPDRTSLTRRREWKAIREQERKARDAMALARAKAQQLASGGMTYENNAASRADKEVMRLYEAYREHRLRDMERRLRRLERNGDVWLQALVPVLENMNKNMAAACDGQLEDSRDWASDGETSGAAEGMDRTKGGMRLMRSSSLSQFRLLEKLNGQAHDDDAWSDSASRSDDASGLGTIEPLMRELAADARRWQKTTQSPVLAGDEQFHAM